MIYGYVRVSSVNQKTDRQEEEMIRYGLSKENIYVDKQSGKDFIREAYQKVYKKLKSNDLLVIKSIDRLGRDYQMIIDEWAKITRDIGADILVLDMPLLDTRQKAENLVGKFISDIVLQILSFVAQNEREVIRQRQAEGIALARARGVHIGRPRKVLPDNFNEVALAYVSHQITNIEARKILQMSKGTFFRYIADFRQNLKKNLLKE